jgi:PAS domain S-box-containing protein
LAEFSYEWLCRQVVDNAQDGIVVADRNGTIWLWNAGAQRIFGFSADEAMGRSLDLIIPEKLRERHWHGYRQTMRTGTTRYDREVLAVPAAHKDGRRISLEFTVTLVRDVGGELFGVAAVMRDVTARWQREKAARRGGTS